MNFFKQNKITPENKKGSKLKDAFLVIIVTLFVSFFMYYFTFTSVGYGNWTFVVMNIVLFSLFILLMPFRKKLNRLPSSVYIAFIIALFAEMYGLPLTMYFFMGFFGYDKIFSLEFLFTKLIGQKTPSTAFTTTMFFQRQKSLLELECYW